MKYEIDEEDLSDFFDELQNVERMLHERRGDAKTPAEGHAFTYYWITLGKARRNFKDRCKEVDEPKVYPTADLTGDKYDFDSYHGRLYKKSDELPDKCVDKCIDVMPCGTPPNTCKQCTDAR